MRSVLLVLSVLVCLIAMGLWRADNPRLVQLRMAVADTLAPGLGWTAGPVEALSAMVRDFENFTDVYAQNRELRREIERLRGWRAEARALEERNAQLGALMNVRLAPRLAFVTGDVIADSGGPFSESVLVNVGERDGVSEGSAAVDGSGLVGRVVGVGERSSRLMLLTDFSSRIAVTIQPSGRRAIMVGDATAAPRLDFIDDTEDVSPGNTVETSGAGGVLPPRLPIGRVIAVGDGQRVALNSDLERLEFVRLLRYRPDRQIDSSGRILGPRRPSPGAELGAEVRPGAETSPVATPGRSRGPSPGASPVLDGGRG
ncbi:MAG: rod shape-determining protein MreC [Pseudomonadota bacterium]